ncbi:4Fe-4S ferredoxin [Thermincola ferriacetica]|uniref:4Fe-4S ferredoxin iron-sulfur binding domain protein n=2 Tax=Thermincola TaxID=278993 RepID=D5X9I7_THEPJ|nr:MULTISPECIES: ferredoxin family protein [Thermincola]ADG83091.1 4Fe-4S ferredoxin iron-sulfur binding domain protein [Thermincola potens JR]KNZ70577.1 4Fe-4S ferredoxin [Thermincola ferriacetica]
MPVKVDKNLCNGCGNATEPRCVRVCPGDLLFKDSANRCAVRDPRDCWDCAACIKECPRQALEMYLPVQIGGRGATLKAKSEQGVLSWFLTKPDGTTETFIIKTRTEKSQS